MNTTIGFIILINLIVILEIIFLIAVGKRKSLSSYLFGQFDQIIGSVNKVIVTIDFIALTYYTSYLIGTLL